MDEPIIWSFNADGKRFFLDMTHCVALVQDKSEVVLIFSGGINYTFQSESGRKEAINAFEISKKTKV